MTSYDVASNIYQVPGPAAAAAAAAAAVCGLLGVGAVAAERGAGDVARHPRRRAAGPAR